MEKTVSTPELRKRIQTAITTILPFYNVSPEKLRQFKDFVIKRKLPEKYSRFDRHDGPAFSFLENFFLFPQEKIMQGEEYEEILLCQGLSCFSQETIFHETGHYIHNQLNPDCAEGIRVVFKTGKRPPGHFNYTELVAEYPLFILGQKRYDDSPHKWRCREMKAKVFDIFGKDFLPELARMPLQDFLAMKLL